MVSRKLNTLALSRPDKKHKERYHRYLLMWNGGVKGMKDTHKVRIAEGDRS